ncbi:ferric reductase-like transmembrane domain-containing protein [Dactylosporangium sp. CA-152071]|uniref:ferric reductase-like transmembrane domain-containing protein n=1 Tax=Dactylosporangium sp. CA-152071 TaxID=3239933 RepID=UPI003D8E3C64
MRTAAKLFAASSLAVATVLWAVGLPTSAPGLAAACRLAALWSTDLLLLQVLGMARIPWLERAFGQDSLGRWHRWTGIAPLALLLAHVVLALVSHVERAGQLWALLTGYRGMVPATVGLLALVLVAATSLRPVCTNWSGWPGSAASAWSRSSARARLPARGCRWCTPTTTTSCSRCASCAR